VNYAKMVIFTPQEDAFYVQVNAKVAQVESAILAIQVFTSHRHFVLNVQRTALNVNQLLTVTSVQITSSEQIQEFVLDALRLAHLVKTINANHAFLDINLLAQYVALKAAQVAIAKAALLVWLDTF
jgi:aryl carrier-like protein